MRYAASWPISSAYGVGSSAPIASTVMSDQYLKRCRSSAGMPSMFTITMTGSGKA